MGNYESQTIEQAGGRGNEIKPQLVTYWLVPLPLIFIFKFIIVVTEVS